MEDQLIRLFGEILNLNSDVLSDDTAPTNTPQWDSLVNMLLISAIEETFALELETFEIEAMKDIRGVRAILRARGAKV